VSSAPQRLSDDRGVPAGVRVTPDQAERPCTHGWAVGDDNESAIILDAMRAGTILREARHRAGLSQRGLAARAGVPQPAISRIERDHVSPRLDTLDVLLRSCGVALDLVDRPGRDVDRSLIRERLRLSLLERARTTAAEWNATRPIRERGAKPR
jgi:transcriptional regulator with XRE-family HTH domain